MHVSNVFFFIELAKPVRMVHESAILFILFFFTGFVYHFVDYSMLAFPKEFATCADLCCMVVLKLGMPSNRGQCSHRLN